MSLVRNDIAINAIEKRVKSFPSFSAHWAAPISVSVTLGHTSAETEATAGAGGAEGFRLASTKTSRQNCCVSILLACSRTYSFTDVYKKLHIIGCNGPRSQVTVWWYSDIAMIVLVMHTSRVRKDVCNVRYIVQQLITNFRGRVRY